MPASHVARFMIAVVVLLVAPLGSAVAQDKPRPMKVFILAGQSNMEGQGVVDLEGKDYNEGKGTLRSLMKNPATSERFKHLVDAKGKWTVRDDVWVSYQPEDQPLRAGPLTFGFTPYGDQHHFGPELQFGHVVGDSIENEVLLIKTAWGGKSLYTDFRPPSSGGTTGPYYTAMIRQVKEALEHIARDFPKSKAVGYELAGFVWYHGWNDGCDPKHAVPEYEENLAHLIQDVRRDLKAPKLPVVIGELTGPWVQAEGEWEAVRKAQAAVAARPEFAGTVSFVPTHDFVRKPEESPNPGHGHHEFGNAETYFLVGDALGKAMVGLLAPVPVSPPGTPAPASPTAKPDAPAKDGAKPPRPAADPPGFPLGLEGVTGESDEQKRLIRITGISRASTGAGLLRVGDELLGVHGKRFAEDARGEFAGAVSAAREPNSEQNLRLIHRRDGVERTLDFLVEPPPPDLTRGGTKSGDPDWNLGPTGAKGWIFGRGFDTSDARQILVTGVDAGSPADGILAAGDIILGLDGADFDADARVTLGNAITRAELPENKGTLRLVRWRQGTREDVKVTLEASGRWSETSPYDCPKAKLIVEQGCRAIMKRGLKIDLDSLKHQEWNPDIPTTINALALLASGDPQYAKAVAEYAHAVAPRDLKLPLQEGMYSWTWSYANLFAAEYYLSTGDESVLPAIREYSSLIARGQSTVGTWGHGFRVPGNNGTLGGYGAVNQAGLICWLSLALAQRCGIHDPDIDRAVDLSRAFFGFYIGKGAIPYGDHPPYWLHDDNGKSGSAAIAFDILGDRRGASFFTRMATAAYGEKELGHTGNYFGLLWGALAANRAGPDAVAAFLREQRWYYDLARRWDGSFFTTERDNYNWDMTGVFVLHAALPLRSLVITGKGAGEDGRLTGRALGAVIASGREFSVGRFDDACQLMSTADLLRDIADWSPTRRQRAATALAERREEAVLPALIGMLRAEQADARYGACLTLQYMEERAAPATEQLIALLAEKDMWLRTRAAFALSSIGRPAMKAVPELLRLSVEVDPDDPRGMQAKYLSFALFRADFVDQIPRKRGLLADSLKGVDRELAMPAIRRMLASDDGLATMSVRSIFKTLSTTELESLLPEILGVAGRTAPSGEMFAQEIRVDALRFLARHRIKAGLPVFIEYVSTQNGWGRRTTDVLPLLKEYGKDAAEVLPALIELRGKWRAREEAEHEEGVTRSSVASEVIASIEEAVSAAGGADGQPARNRK